MIRAFNALSGEGGGPVIELNADLALKFDATMDEIRKYVRWKAWQERTFERYLSRPFGFHVPEEPLFGSTQVAVAHDLGGPAEGRIWQVDRFSCDVSPLGAVRPEGVSVGLATAPGEREGEAIQLHPDSMFWTGTMTEWLEVGYPAYGDWGSRELVVTPLFHLFVLVVQPHPQMLHEAQAHQVAGRVQVTDLVYHEEHHRALALEQP